MIVHIGHMGLHKMDLILINPLQMGIKQCDDIKCISINL